MEGSSNSTCKDVFCNSTQKNSSLNSIKKYALHIQYKRKAPEIQLICQALEKERLFKFNERKVFKFNIKGNAIQIQH